MPLRQNGDLVVIFNPGSLIMRLGKASTSMPLESVNVYHQSSNHDNIASKNSVGSYTPFNYAVVKDQDFLTQNFSESLSSASDFSSFLNVKSCSQPASNDQITVPTNRQLSIWPFQYGFLNSNFSLASILHETEKSWKSKLKSLDINFDNLSQYTAILLMDSVYNRRDIRLLVDLLLNTIGFGNILLQISSTCVTYALKMPSALVVDVGALKTTLTPVDEGCALVESAVMLPIGHLHVLALFKSVLIEAGIFSPDCSKKVASIEEMRMLEALLATLNDLYFNSLDQPDLDSPIVLPSFFSAGHPVNLQELRIDRALLEKINTAPFNQTVRVTYNVSPTVSSQPDDPFDEMYVSLTARERRQLKKKVTDEEGNKVPSKEEETAMQMVQVPATEPQHPRTFDSVHEAAWWSVAECGRLATQHALSDCGGGGGGATTPVEAQIIASVTGEECMKRLLNCVICVGGGTVGFAGRFLERWLCETLATAAETRHTWISGGPMLEVISRPVKAAQLAWMGASLIATTDSMSELCVSMEEWRKLGSRALREKALFRW